MERTEKLLTGQPPSWIILWERLALWHPGQDPVRMENNKAEIIMRKTGYGDVLTVGRAS